MYLKDFYNKGSAAPKGLEDKYYICVKCFQSSNWENFLKVDFSTYEKSMTQLFQNAFRVKKKDRISNFQESNQTASHNIFSIKNLIAVIEPK